MFSLKNVYKWVKHGFATESKRQNIEWKYIDSRVKKKVPGAGSSKEAHAYSLLRYEKRYHDCFH